MTDPEAAPKRPRGEDGRIRKEAAQQSTRAAVLQSFQERRLYKLWVRVRKWRDSPPLGKPRRKAQTELDRLALRHEALEGREVDDPALEELLEQVLARQRAADRKR